MKAQFGKNIEEDLNEIIKSMKEICERNLKGNSKVKKNAWMSEDNWN